MRIGQTNTVYTAVAKRLLRPTIRKVAFWLWDPRATPPSLFLYISWCNFANARLYRACHRL